MSKQKEKIFTTFEEYLEFYANDKSEKPNKQNKYADIGVRIAKLACEKAAKEVWPDNNA